MVTAIILAGGVGSRVGAGRPKQFIEVLGKPVLAYTIEIFQNNPQIDAIGPQINTVLAAGSIPKRKGTIEAFTRLLLNRPFIATWALLKFFLFSIILCKNVME